METVNSATVNDSVKYKSNNKNNRLIDTICSTKCFELLNTFLFKPTEGMYQSEIVKKSGLSPNTAIPLLRELTHQGILHEEVVAGTIFYHVEEDNPIVRHLRILSNVTNVYEVSKEVASDVQIYIFGSAARGEDTENSHIDILMLANGSSDDLDELKSRLKQDISKKLDREVNLVAYTPAQYSALHYEKKLLFESIENEKIKVL
jgi:predicted nucleotidyltransferase